jgi:hypothetical protein
VQEHPSPSAAVATHSCALALLAIAPFPWHLPLQSQRAIGMSCWQDVRARISSGRHQRTASIAWREGELGVCDVVGIVMVPDVFF